MKKVGVLVKEKAVEQLENKWSKADACLFVSLEKVKAFPVNCLRNDLKKEDTSVLVAKSSLIKRVLSGKGLNEAGELYDGQTAVVFVDGDVVKVSKMLVDFSKEHEGFTLKGGILQENKIAKEKIVELSKLPSREQLLAQAVGAIAAPLTSFAAALNNVILKFVWVVEEIKKKKTESGS